MFAVEGGKGVVRQGYHSIYRSNVDIDKLAVCTRMNASYDKPGAAIRAGMGTVYVGKYYYSSCTSFFLQCQRFVTFSLIF